MHHTHFGVAYRSEATVRLRTKIAHSFYLAILAEIEVLRRVKDRASRFLEILVRNFTILIDIKQIEHLLKLCFIHIEAPVIAEILELPLLEFARVA